MPMVCPDGVLMIAFIVATLILVSTIPPQPPPPPPTETYRVTAYCSCEICCGEYAKNRPNGIVYGASGEELKAGYSIAASHDLSFNTKVIIEGHTFEVQDRLATWVTDKYGLCIDIYFTDHERARQFGVKYLEVEVKHDND